MTSVLPAGLELNISKPPQVEGAPRATRFTEAQGGGATESFRKILDDKRGMEADNGPQVPEEAKVRQPEADVRRKTDSREERECAPSAGGSTQTADPVVEQSPPAESGCRAGTHETGEPEPASSESERTVATTSGAQPGLPNLSEQVAESPEVRPLAPLQAAPPQTPAIMPQADPVRSVIAADAVRQFTERPGLRATKSPEPPPAGQPAIGTSESGRGKEVAPAFEGILKPDRVALPFQASGEASPETNAKADEKNQPQSVRRSVGEIHAMVRPDPADSAPVRFSELPNATMAPAAMRSEQIAPGPSQTAQLAAPAEIAGLRSMARIEELLQPTSAAPAPLRSLNIQVEQGGRPVAVVHLEQQMAGMQVAVRSHTPAITEALRAELPQLVRSLQDGGMRADFHPRAVVSGESAASAAPSMRSGTNDRGGDNQEHPRAGTFNWQQRERRQERNDRHEPVQEEDEMKTKEGK